MSAPDTNKKKDAKRHKGPLMGMVGVVIFAVILLGLLSIYVVNRGNEPADSTPISEETESGGAVTEEIQDAQGADAQEE
ncbi:hypothetical protein SAMN04488020_101372 [Palleronia marisminoris]|uniref:Uncharacterized protein n=1 Tax=Palleronia marisminoris TaxID=315423 RepID=A0A1Y5RFK1_9RHOB|nr:hypothetical protein [Palleronia marisminoris]SFG16585.1 hypothetical protein SAMN04488020_101372 [Palleronia marisminoris]SLN16387.1 hypothetical protein PAM7066_00372 [Palleronia marisminoris]